MLALAMLITSCRKTEEKLIPDNKAPDYNSISTIKLENYVNRIFIDLLGREATDVERVAVTARLRAAGIRIAEREAVIRELQNDSTYHYGDSSYRHAYYQRIYDLSKARFLEGASDPEIGENIGNLWFSITIARLEGDSVAVYSALDQIDRYQNVLSSRYWYRTGLISYNEMCAYMCDNDIYDVINMNSFNYVNATFDDLFGRAPLQHELYKGIDIMDKNKPNEILGQWASNKKEYCKVLTTCNEFYEGQIRWMYFVLLQREATTQEVINLFGNYISTRDLQQVQRQIMKTDEYAQFN